MEVESECPYCGEAVTLWLDDDPGAIGEQRYVEDCSVCCRPWQVHAWRDVDGTLFASLQRLDD